MDLARASAVNFFAAVALYSRGTSVMFSVPPTMNTSPRPTIIFSAACVTLSKPDAQLRCTVTALTVSGTPARRAMTRAMLAASAGCATQPKITSSMVAGSRPVLASSSATATRPSSTASVSAKAVPILAKGVRTPSTM